jgi:hypothetical protein
VTAYISREAPAMSTPELRTNRSGTPFRVGEALGESLNVLTKNLLPFLLVAAIGRAPVVYVQWLIRVDPSSAISLFFESLVAQYLLATLCQAVVVYATFQSLRGRPASIARSFTYALGRIIPVILTGLLSTAIVFVGCLLLLVPGIIASVGLIAAIPACMAEKLGPMASLSRSWALTEFHKGAIFGATLAIGIGSGVVEYMFRQIQDPAAYTIAVYVLGTLVGAYSAVLSTVIYHGLRVEKEGVDVDQIAAVFD